MDMKTMKKILFGWVITIPMALGFTALCTWLLTLGYEKPAAPKNLIYMNNMNLFGMWQ